MTLTPLSSPESGRKKFLMNRTYIMSRKWESTEAVFGLGKKKFFDELEAEMTLTPI